MKTDSEVEEVCFVHVPKTGGISLIEAVRPMANAGEVTIVQRGLNFFSAKVKSSGRLLTFIGHNNRLLGYMTLAEYKRQCSSLCFTYAFVRNPFDRLVSAFEYLRMGGGNIGDQADADRYVNRFGSNFEAFVFNGLNSSDSGILSQMHFRPQIEWVCSAQGIVLLDYVGRFETMVVEMKELTKRFSLPIGEIPHLNSTVRRDYRTYYSTGTREVVANVYRRDLEMFGYTF